MDVTKEQKYNKEEFSNYALKLMDTVILIDSAIVGESSVFKKMIEWSTRVNKIEITYEVETDDDKNIIIDIVRFLYGFNDFKGSCEYFLSLLLRSIEFDVSGLTQRCLDELVDKLNIATLNALTDIQTRVCTHLDISCVMEKIHKFVDNEFGKHCLGNIDECPHEFYELTMPSLIIVMTCPTLNATSENDIYCAIRNWWHKSENNKLLDQTIVKQLIDCICFEKMTNDFLIDVADTKNTFFGENVQQYYSDKVATAIKFNSFSNGRKRIMSSKNMIDRKYKDDVVEIEAEFDICDVSKKLKTSGSCYLNGYYYSLGMNNMDGMFAAYVAVDRDKTCFIDKNKYYLENESKMFRYDFLLCAWIERGWVKSKDTYCADDDNKLAVNELGYGNFYGMSLKELINNMKYVKDDKVKVKAQLSIAKKVCFSVAQ